MNIIAEIGCNHKGNMDLAKFLILEAKIAGANVAKFQKRNNKELLTSEEYRAPHPNSKHSYGNTYGEHREFLEFNQSQHEELKNFCEKHDILYSTSVWDLTSAREIIELNPQLIKVPSAMNNNWNLLEMLCKQYNGEIHISTGMTTYQEIEEIVQYLEKYERAKDTVIYNCTSGYPVPVEDIKLLEIKRLKENYQHRVKAIGFSGHHHGIAIDIAAVTLGATWIERHFTKNKNWKGTDHSASLEPSELKMLVQQVSDIEIALDYKDGILPIEQVQKNKLKFKKK